MYASVPGTSPTAVSVSASSNWARPKSSSRIEIVGAFLDEHVRRLHVAVDDPERCAWASASRICAAASTASRSPSLPAAQRLAQRAALHVLVGDVDVAAVAAEVVGADAALVAQPRGRLHLARGARRALALARDDLERDLEAGALVAGKPDRAGATAAERPQGPVAVEDEVGCGKGVRGARHGHRLFAAAADRPSEPKHGVHSAPSPDGSRLL